MQKNPYSYVTCDMSHMNHDFFCMICKNIYRGTLFKDFKQFLRVLFFWFKFSVGLNYALYLRVCHMSCCYVQCHVAMYTLTRLHWDFFFNPNPGQFLKPYQILFSFHGVA